MNRRNKAKLPKPLPSEEQLREINQHIQEGVNHWADIMLMADADEWSVLLEYEPIDLHNALFILMHIGSCAKVRG